MNVVVASMQLKSAINFFVKNASRKPAARALKVKIPTDNCCGQKVFGEIKSRTLHMKFLKIALGISIGLYAISVGFLALTKVVGVNQRLSMPEILYGPAITIASSWVIFGVIYALLRKKNRNN